MSFGSPCQPDTLGSSPKHRYFTKGAGEWIDANGTHYPGADLDLQTIGGSSARSLVWLADGTLDLVTAGGSGTAEAGAIMPSGSSLDLQATKIMGTSTCASVCVLW